MVRFVESSLNKKPTLTILDKEDDPIKDGVTVQVDLDALTFPRLSTWQPSNGVMLKREIYRDI